MQSYNKVEIAQTIDTRRQQSELA